MTPTVPRYHGLDLIRLLSFIAICIFHITFIHYFTASIEIAQHSVIFTLMEYFARSLAFSGFTVAALTSALTALSGQGLKKRLRLFTFLVFGWCVFSVLIERGDMLLMWDIYPLIFVGILSATAAETLHPWGSRALGIVGLMMLWVPFWELRQLVTLPHELKVALGFGDCQVDQVEWPVLPWIGLIWLGYAIGQSLREIWQTKRSDALRLTLAEGAVWGILLAASTAEFGAFYHINLGEFFACEAYRQTPLTWWAHMLWPLFALRLSVEPRVQSWLARRTLCRLVSGLAVSRKFWIAYITSYLLAHVISAVGTATGLEQTEWRVPATIAFGLAYFPLIEYVTRLVLRSSEWYLKRLDRLPLQGPSG
jgi:uncharacterized membrane protein